MNINTNNLIRPPLVLNAKETKPVQNQAGVKPVVSLGPLHQTGSLTPLVQTSGLITPIRPVAGDPRALQEVTGAELTGKQEPVPATEAERERAEIIQATREFESVFMQYLASAMGSSLPGSDMEGGHFYKGLIESQLGRVLAESGGLHLGDSLVNQIQKLSEGE